MPLEEELGAMKSIGTFLNQFASRHVDIQNSVKNRDHLLVPRTLTKLLEAIAYSQLSSPSTPLKVTLETHRDQLILTFPSNFSLISEEQLYETLKEVQEQYLWLGKQMKWSANATFFIHIPLEKLFHQAPEKEISSSSPF